MITSETKIVSGKDEFSEIVIVNEVHLKQLQKLIVKMEEYFSIYNKAFLYNNRLFSITPFL